MKEIKKDHLGLWMKVYRAEDTCTKGASIRCNTIWVANDLHVELPGKPLFRDTGHVTRAEAEKSGHPLFRVDCKGGRRNVVPIMMDDDLSHPWFMFGGNFAYTSDSRGPSVPVHIHDRTERSSGQCYPFFGIGDKPLDIGGFDDKESYMRYLAALVSDLQQSGMEATAEDFLNCMRWMKRRL